MSTTNNNPPMKRLFCLLLVTPLLLQTSVLAADPLDQWYWRNPLPTGNEITDVIYANGLFRAVDSGGEILTSSDGVDWTIRNCGYNCILDGIACAQSSYVAVGWHWASFGPEDEGGLPVVLTSSNGVSWTSQSFGDGGDGALAKVCYGNDLFVAVGSGDSDCPIFTSPDGVHWAGQAPGIISGLHFSLQSVAYGNGIFVATGAADAFFSTQPVLTSPDGTNWTIVQIEITASLNAVSFVNGSFALLGQSVEPNTAALLLSSDGLTWTNCSFAVDDGCSLYSAGYAAGTYVLAGSTSKGNALFTSPDLGSWTERDVSVNLNYSTVAYGKGVFVVGGFDGIVSSTNGTDWAKLGSEAAGSFFGVVYDRDEFVAVGIGGAVARSEDGVSWSAATTVTTNNLWSIASANSFFAAVGDAGTIITSTNGMDWTVRGSGVTSNTIADICAGDGMLVAVTRAGEILASTNGTQWALVSSGEVADLYGVAFGQGTFVAVGWSGGDSFSLVSTDGLTWASFPQDPTTDLERLCYGNGVFVAVEDGPIKTSNDGSNWTPVASQPDIGQTCSRVVWAHGTFVVVGGKGTLLTSTNGADWIARNCWAGFNLDGVAYGRGTFVIVGDYGILQSDPLPLWGLDLKPVGPQTNGAFALEASGPADQTWEIDTSTNLVDWTWLAQFPNTNTVMPVLDSGARGCSRRFYRGQRW